MPITPQDRFDFLLSVSRPAIKTDIASTGPFTNSPAAYKCDLRTFWSAIQKGGTTGSRMDSISAAVTSFAEHYHRERNPQGKGTVLLCPRAEQRAGRREGKVRCQERLGCLLKDYHSTA